MQGINFSFSIYHASWHEVSSPLYIMPLGAKFQLPFKSYLLAWSFSSRSTFCGVWFSYDYNMPLDVKFYLPLHFSYVEFGSHHIVVGLLAQSWAPINLQYAIPSQLLKSLYVVCGLVVYHVIILWSMCGLIIYQVIILLSMCHLVVCQVIILVSMCHHCVVIMVSLWVVSIMFGISKSLVEGLPVVLTSWKGTTFSLYHGKNNSKID